jgi:hypothetical protein
VHDPITHATWEIERSDIVAWLKKMRPKCSRSGKTSSCMGRKAPPESTRYTHGSRLCSATSCARRCFLTVTG